MRKACLSVTPTYVSPDAHRFFDALDEGKTGYLGARDFLAAFRIYDEGSPAGKAVKKVQRNTVLTTRISYCLSSGMKMSIIRSLILLLQQSWWYSERLALPLLIFPLTMTWQ